MANNYSACIDYETIESSKDKLQTDYDAIPSFYNIEFSTDPLFELGRELTNYEVDNCFKQNIETITNLRESTKNTGKKIRGEDGLDKKMIDIYDIFKDAEMEISNDFLKKLDKVDELFGTSISAAAIEGNWNITDSQKLFEKHMTDETKEKVEALIKETEAEIAEYAISATGAEDESEKTGATVIGSVWNSILFGAQLPMALAYLNTMEQPVGPLSNEGYREALAKALKEKYPTMSDETINKAIDTYIDSKQKSSSDVNEETGGDDGDGDDNNNGGGDGGTSPNSNETQYREETPTPEPNNTPQRQENPTPKPEEKPSTPEETPVKEEEKEPTIIEEEEKVPETPSEEKPSTTPEPETPPSNNNSNNNQTNTGENANNSGVVNNTPSTGGNTNSGNNYYAPNNNNGGGNYNSGASSNTPTTSTGTPNENASTTTPSAPESDAGINDNSGETLDVISIDKDGGKSSASTSSNDGGSVVPTILGVGVAGAAAVAGAKILHDKKKKENEYIYEEDGSTESDNSFANLESYTGDDTVDTTDTMSPGKYRAGSANNLVLEGSPSDIKIDESIADIPNQKEELE